MTQQAPQYRHTERRMEGQRLAYYRAEASGAYWDDVWEKTINADTYAAAEKGHIGIFEFDQFISQYLPRNGHLLEAGCGNGHLVLALRKRGYDIEGVEWGQATVDRVRVIRPDLPIRYGDVTQLEVPDGYYQGYLSIGVVEHRREGPEPFLAEAHRILNTDGVALISVPYLNPMRAFKGRLGLYRGTLAACHFINMPTRAARLQTMSRQQALLLLARPPMTQSKG